MDRQSPECLVPRGDDAALALPRDLALDALDHAEWMDRRQGDPARPTIWMVGALVYALLEVAKQIRELTVAVKARKR